MASKHMKRRSTPLIIREMKIKIAVRYYFTVMRMAIAKQRQNQKTVLRLASHVERMEPCALLGMEVRYGKQHVTLKSHHMTQQFCLLVYIQRNQKQGLEERLVHPCS